MLFFKGARLIANPHEGAEKKWSATDGNMEGLPIHH